MKKVKGIIVGAGNRGKVYSKYALEYPNNFQIIGVSEPRLHAREWMRKTFNIKEERCFESWKNLSDLNKLADCAIICTQDQDHVGAVIALANKGYHILLEKPMAVTSEDCHKIYEVCKKNNVILAVCHVLRYHPSVKKVKELIDSGIIGDVVNINHIEPIGFWHFAHSFVRGNWSNSSKSTFSLLSKCCHDVDLICYWMSSQKCTQISSFGSLVHFRKENKPFGAGERCLDCNVEVSCPYSSKKIYLDPNPSSPIFPMHAVCDLEDSKEGYMYHLSKNLSTGPYGKCVYDCDNDVCDNQVVNFQFENGSTATLTMIAFSEEVCNRQTSVYGTKGELKWSGDTVQHFDFLQRLPTTHLCNEDKPKSNWGHGGSDFYTIQSFIQAVATNDTEAISTGPRISLASHLLTFAAEESRVTGKIIRPQEDPKWIIS